MRITEEDKENLINAREIVDGISKRYSDEDGSARFVIRLQKISSEIDHMILTYTDFKRSKKQ